MSKLNVEMYGHIIEVEYDYTAPEKGNSRTPSIEEWVDIIDYKFESEEIADEFGLYKDSTRWIFEGELAEMIAAHERTQNVKKYGRYEF